ncbi:glycosyl transferase [Brachyspira hampsonii]|uniref:Glycosyl transferase n=1 Tax=Brachyspira hampsonii TaxID=1287055 RepID=A0AAC9TT49_9SPIR|nr:glycosyltransferase family 2 protein [Brachyspira hampsonii]ASJ20169.1 glycosyl transferase [Brachyspira hampsonii]OEJ16569.1 glycosyl transferase [Brachyspira hampsonii]
MCKINCFFSIIIPVYNTERYLKRCINSIINQTFTEFEIIIVDDCSNGNCKEIINSYNDNRIIYIKHEQNKGTLSSRKTGSIEAKGDYITYIDPDDELKLNALEKVFNTIKDNDYDVIQFSVKSVSSNPNKKEKLKEEKRVSWYLSTKRSNIDNNYLLNEILNEKISHNIWAKFFKSSIVKKSVIYIPDDHITFAEDMLQCLIFFYFVKTYKAIYDELYIYHCDLSYSNKNAESLTKDRFNKMCLDSKKSLDEFYNFLIKMNDNILYKYDYMKLAYNQYKFLLYKINNNNEYMHILNKYFDKDFLEEYNKYKYHYDYYLKTEEKLKVINNKLLPYFFSIILDGFYTNIRIFGININIKNNKNYTTPVIITFSNILRILFSIQFSNKNTKINLLGFNFVIEKRG